MAVLRQKRWNLQQEYCFRESVRGFIYNLINPPVSMTNSFHLQSETFYSQERYQMIA